MPIHANIINRQRRLRDAGEIRIGDSTPAVSKSGKPFDRPFALDTFRLSTVDKNVLEAAAKVFGGEVRWVEKLQKWDLITERAQLKAYVSLKPIDPEVPEGDCESLVQWFELYEKPGSPMRQCDGATCTTWKNGDRVKVPCLCGEQRKCKLVTRFKVMLPEIVSDGLWTLKTHSAVFDQNVHSFFENLMELGLGTRLVPVTLTLQKVDKAKDPNSTQAGESFPLVTLSLDPKPVSLPQMFHDIRMAILAPADFGDEPSTPAFPTEVTAEPTTVEPTGSEAEFELQPPTDPAWVRAVAAAESIGGTEQDLRDLVEVSGDLKAKNMVAAAVSNGLTWEQMMKDNGLVAP